MEGYESDFNSYLPSTYVLFENHALFQEPHTVLLYNHLASYDTVCSHDHNFPNAALFLLSRCLHLFHLYDQPSLTPQPV